MKCRLRRGPSHATAVGGKGTTSLASLHHHVIVALLVQLPVVAGLAPQCPAMRHLNLVRPVLAPRIVPPVAKVARWQHAELAYELLHERVQASRVGPLVHSALKLLQDVSWHWSDWVKPLAESLWQPLDIATIVAVWALRGPASRLAHSMASDMAPAEWKGPFEESIFPVLSEVALQFSRLFAVLLLADAACWTLSCTKVMPKMVAGAIPTVLDTVGYSLLSGFLFTRVKTHLVRKSAGSSAAEKLKGIPATIDRLWGALIWFFAGAGCAQVLSVELGFRLKSVLALGGFSSVVVGLACQTPLANVVKGLIIAASGSFGTGDKIASAGMTGVVEDFGCVIARDCT